MDKKLGKLVETYNGVEFDIRKGTDDYRKRILRLSNEVIDPYSQKVLTDGLDRAVEEYRAKGNFDEIKKIISQVTSRIAYAIGLTSKDRESKKEDLDDTVERGIKYVSAVKSREGVEKEAKDRVIKLNREISDLERKLAA